MIQMGTPIDAIQVYDLRDVMVVDQHVCVYVWLWTKQCCKSKSINEWSIVWNAQVDKHYRDRLAQEDLADPQWKAVWHLMNSPKF